MNAKRKVTEMQNKLSLPKFKNFLWHLQPHWLGRFDHGHWWKQPDIKPTLEAMLWEIFRRHPQTSGFYLRISAGKASGESPVWAPVPLVAAYCCESWPSLGKNARKLWRDYLATRPPQRGHPGGVMLLNGYREGLNDLKDSDQGNTKLTPEKMRRHAMVLTLQRNLPAEVVEQDNQGRILIAIDPQCPGVGKRVERIARMWRKGKKTVKIGKPRIGQWGEVISLFESMELSRKPSEKRNDQLFARYRRVVEGKDPEPDGINTD